MLLYYTFSILIGAHDVTRCCNHKYQLLSERLGQIDVIGYAKN